jgi:hypothetical protein
VSTPQMDLLYMQAYGHVLGIFTRNAEPIQLESSVAGFVASEGFHLRGLTPGPPSGSGVPNQQTSSVVPQNLIAVMRTAQPSTGQPPSPQSCCVSPLSPGPPTMAQNFAAGWTISVSTSMYPPTLTPSQSISAGTLALVLAIDATGNPTPVQWTISPWLTGSPAITIPVPASLTAGLYSLLAFVPNFPIAIGSCTVP